MILITVHDKVAGTWSAPTVVENKACAVRDFRTATSKPGSILAEHPDDYELWIIGEWIVPYDLKKVPSLSVFDNFEFVECGVPHDGKD